MTDDVPVYSLLEQHEDIATYRIPDTVRGTDAWIEIGLFPWELEGVGMGEAMMQVFAPDVADKDLRDEFEQHEGVGLHVDLTGPSHRHPVCRKYKDRVKEMHDVFSSGSNGFRIKNADPESLRQTGRWIGLYAFAYWWWIDEHSDYPLHKHGTRKENRAPKIEDVRSDGTLIGPDGNQFESPYSLDDIEFRSPDDWATPQEIAAEEIQETVNYLLDRHSRRPVRKALRAVEDGMSQRIEKTDAKKERDRFVAALKDGDGVGHSTRRKIISEFDTVDDLCEDIRRGGDRLKSLTAIGESREQDVIDALVESGEWEPAEDEQLTDYT